MATIVDVIVSTALFGGVCLVIGGGLYITSTIAIAVATPAGFPPWNLMIFNVFKYGAWTFVIMIGFGTIVYMTNFNGIRDRIEAMR